MEWYLFGVEVIELNRITHEKERQKRRKAPKSKPTCKKDDDIILGNVDIALNHHIHIQVPNKTITSKVEQTLVEDGQITSLMEKASVTSND